MTTSTVMEQRTLTRMGRIEAGEWLIWLTVLLMLGGGLLLRSRIEGRVATFQDENVTLTYPLDWASLADKEEYQVFHVVDPTSSVQFPTSVRIRRIPLGDLGRAASSLGDVALSWSTRQGRRYPIYNVLQIVQAEVRDQPAIAVDYAYVADPAVGGSAGSIPSVVRAQDLLLKHADMITVVTFEASVETYQQEQRHWEQILRSLDVR